MIVITAPTSQIGRQLLAELARTGKPVRVVARDPARLPESLRTRVDIVQGSHGNPDVVDRAFSGADTVFWLVPPNLQAPNAHAAYVDFTRPACEALKRHEVKRVVNVSAIGRNTSWASKAGFVTASLAMDDLIADTGVHLRTLALPSFFDNVLRQVPAIRAGKYYWPVAPDRRLPGCATRDIAAAAARLLCDPLWTGRADVPVLGPEDLSGDDMVQIMSATLGRTVRYEQVPFGAFKAGLLKRGMSDAMTQGMVDMMVAKNEGLDNGERRTGATSSPTTFAEWCEQVLKPAVLS